ncbi:protein TolR [Acidithiobacillus ferriphilus]|uniref:protein TolR n=2 Tax=Acidithiobacillus ferriphilus TaxID=1689834 RepID=UPI002DB6319E|nr:protein TolR [Acidithiobacillus ferriphilus]MEB8536702.1 protein TolR [Acidithiobacillus ferriphilus]
MKRRRLMAEMNVVPYIDVTLVLLVIFMLSAPLLTQGVNVNLPKGVTKPVSDKTPPVLISVTRQGAISVQYKQSHSTVALDDLATMVRHIAAASHDQVQVLVGGDTHVDYGKVMAVMARLQEAGISHVGLLTRQEGH